MSSKTTEDSDKQSSSSSRARAAESPSIIVERRQIDILCGRGMPIQNHYGNLRMHQIIDKYRERYVASSKRDKHVLTKQVVAEIKEDGARFLKRVDEDDMRCWAEVDDSSAYEKVSHALRCKHKRARQSSMPAPSSSNDSRPQQAQRPPVNQPIPNALTVPRPPTGVVNHNPLLLPQTIPDLILQQRLLAARNLNLSNANALPILGVVNPQLANSNQVLDELAIAALYNDLRRQYPWL